MIDTERALDSMIHSCPSRARANRLRISAEPIRYHSLHLCAPATRSRTAAPELRPSIVAYRSRLIRRGIRRCSARDNGAEKPATHDLVDGGAHALVHGRHMFEEGLCGAERALLDGDTADMAGNAGYAKQLAFRPDSRVFGFDDDFSTPPVSHKIS